MKTTTLNIPEPIITLMKKKGWLNASGDLTKQGRVGVAAIFKDFVSAAPARINQEAAKMTVNLKLAPRHTVRRRSFIEGIRSRVDSRKTKSRPVMLSCYDPKRGGIVHIFVTRGEKARIKRLAESLAMTVSQLIFRS